MFSRQCSVGSGEVVDCSVYTVDCKGWECFLRQAQDDSGQGLVVRVLGFGFWVVGSSELEVGCDAETSSA